MMPVNRDPRITRPKSTSTITYDVTAEGVGPVQVYTPGATPRPVRSVHTAAHCVHHLIDRPEGEEASRRHPVLRLPRLVREEHHGHPQALVEAPVVPDPQVQESFVVRQVTALQGRVDVENQGEVDLGIYTTKPGGVT